MALSISLCPCSTQPPPRPRVRRPAGRVKTWRYIKRTGDPFKDGDDGWFAYHSGWANKGVANTTHVKCTRTIGRGDAVARAPFGGDARPFFFYAGMKFMVRYSRRLLDVLVDEYLKKGQWAQDECEAAGVGVGLRLAPTHSPARRWFASTICAHQLADFNRTPCTVRDYQARRRGRVGGSRVSLAPIRQEIPHLFSDRWWCCPPPFKEADWHYSVDNKPKLFHAMKF